MRTSPVQLWKASWLYSLLCHSQPNLASRCRPRRYRNKVKSGWRAHGPARHATKALCARRTPGVERMCCARKTVVLRIVMLTNMIRRISRLGGCSICAKYNTSFRPKMIVIGKLQLAICFDSLRRFSWSQKATSTRQIPLRRPQSDVLLESHLVTCTEHVHRPRRLSKTSVWEILSVSSILLLAVGSRLRFSVEYLPYLLARVGGSRLVVIHCFHNFAYSTESFGARCLADLASLPPITYFGPRGPQH